ncbi:chromatin-remodeling complex subunit ies6 [Malassezia obtusa]|uniref:Chromatin-remodeling complex subunit ies6 n=1 Tax=Malassezia obtusa TaxID=76774 RepID=A0AAF0ISK5_9BASI|nr:chromatin-remodeling complex subunit ies6 [Malassezia obtusa]
MSNAVPTAEEASVFHAPRPFKSAAYTERYSGSTRRNKTLKQILNSERDAQFQRLGIDKKRKDAKRRKTDEAAAAAAPDAGTAAPDAPGVPPSPAPEASERRVVPTYTSVEAPPSLLPAKRYCDVTGLQALYTDPKTRLRYHSAEIYDIIRGFVRAID